MNTEEQKSEIKITIEEMERTLNNEDIITAKQDSISIINKMLETDLFYDLSFSNKYLEFLSFSFDLFYQDEEMLEKCIDMLLRTKLNKSKADKFKLTKVINDLSRNEKYKNALLFIKNSICEAEENKGERENIKRRKTTTKRVSWKEEIADVKFFVVETDEPHFKHGGYKDKDYKEADILKNVKKDGIEEEIDWHDLEKLELPDQGYKIKEESEEILIQQEREKNDIRITNNFLGNEDFEPFSKNIEEGVEGEETFEVPLINMALKNNTPQLDYIGMINNSEGMKIVVDEVLNDPKILEQLLNKD